MVTSVGKKSSNLCYPLRIGIIIPVYKDDGYLEPIIRQIEGLIGDQEEYRLEVLIVDDGSPSPIRKISSDRLPVTYLRFRKNQGKGSAIKAGFDYFTHKQNIEAVITLDADLQHPPALIPVLIRRYKKFKPAMVVGYRSRKIGVMPFHRIISNMTTSLIISFLTGKYVRDSQCGFRLYGSQLFKSVQVEENGFHFESEIMLHCLWKHRRVDFVSIPTIYNAGRSSINNLSDTLKFIKVVMKSLKKRITGNV